MEAGALPTWNALPAYSSSRRRFSAGAGLGSAPSHTVTNPDSAQDRFNIGASFHLHIDMAPPALDRIRITDRWFSRGEVSPIAAFHVGTDLANPAIQSDGSNLLELTGILVAIPYHHQPVALRYAGGFVMNQHELCFDHLGYV